MHKLISRWGLPVFLLLLTFPLWAQQTGPVQMADTMRSNGKIFVVVAVILTLFTGFLVYLISLDRKISRLEKESGK